MPRHHAWSKGPVIYSELRLHGEHAAQVAQPQLRPSPEAMTANERTVTTTHATLAG